MFSLDPSNHLCVKSHSLTFSSTQTGTINMEISWVHNSQLSTTYLPSSQAALEQLKMNSAETNLRLGNLDNVIAMLRRFPLKFNVREVRLSNIDFYLKDLFSGKQGEAERSDVDATMMNAVFIKNITVSTELHPTKKDNGGIPLYDMLERFFLRGVSSKVMTNYMVYYKGLGSIFGGLFSQVYRTKSSVQTGSLKSTFVSLGNAGWLSEFNMSKKYLQRKYVTADDPDIEKAVLYVVFEHRQTKKHTRTLTTPKHKGTRDTWRRAADQRTSSFLSLAFQVRTCKVLPTMI